MKCLKCLLTLREGARFCNHCGQAVGNISVATVERPRKKRDSFVGRVLDERYKILELIGNGGMGKVFRARRLLLDDDVAIKFLTAHDFSDFPQHQAAKLQKSHTDRFRREAKVSARLNSCPNIATIYDIGLAHDDVPDYIVMELVKGETLRNLLKKERILLPERAVGLMKEICLGMGAAHSAGIVHRDLKPGNIMVLPPDEVRHGETVKIVDFGLAKLRDTVNEETMSRLTLSGMILGTFRYMSPEQFTGGFPDNRADVYSLGIILYEMLCGHTPFHALTVEGYISKHLNERPRPFSPDLQIPFQLERFVLRCLAKDRNRRPKNAIVCLQELGSIRLTNKSYSFAKPENPAHREMKLYHEIKTGSWTGKMLIYAIMVAVSWALIGVFVLSLMPTNR
jgi:serine/threonine-protein kinase